MSNSGNPPVSGKKDLISINNQLLPRLFKKADCHSCPFRADCTRDKSGVRTITLRPKQLHETLFAARARQQTSEFKKQYAARAGIEGTICSWDESLWFTPLSLPRVSQNSIAAYYYCLRY